jgi:hypothetical protein
VVTILEQPPSGRRFGHLESAYPEPPVAKTYSALSVRCPNGHAEAGAPCPPPKVCPERVASAIDALRANQLPETDPVKRVAASDCPACGATMTRSGHLAACGPHHACKRRFPKGTCRRIRMPNSEYCEDHQPRWNDSVN